MKKLVFIAALLALLVAPVTAGATVEGPGEPPSPDCKWVEPVTEQVWVEPQTKVITVVDQEAYDETIPGQCYPAVTHEECTTTCPTATWPKQWYYVNGHNGGWRSFGPITFTYDKSSDPHKCHRPTGASLGVPSQLMDDFNDDFDEWVTKECGTRCSGLCYTVTCETVVDEPAYCDPDTVIHHDAVTHEETVVIEDGYYETVVVTPGYWDCPVPPEPTCETDPTLCPKVVEECKWKGTGFGLFLLEGPDGQMATMYVYEDENGKLPIGISVDRQECVLGWVAVNTPFAGKVWRNTCTGAFRWNGQEFFPRTDVLKDGVCARSGECLK